MLLADWAEKYKKIFLSNQEEALARPFRAYGTRVSPQGSLLLFAEFFSRPFVRRQCYHARII